MTPTPESFTPPPDTNATGDVMQSYGRVWRRVEYAVERSARQLTDDPDERDDLIQEARVELWRIDHSRCNLQNSDDLRYLARALIRRMRKVARTPVNADEVPASVVKALGGTEDRS